MQLYVSLLPPAHVCEAVGEVVRAAYETANETGAAGPAQLDLVPPSLMELPVATFGNVAAGEAARVEQAIRRATTALVAPTVHLEGSGALEFPGDRSVWAQVCGDLDQLRVIPPAITQVVERLGFYVDRRKFRTMLSVATITDATGIEVLQAVVDALDAFRGTAWAIETISLRERLLNTDPPRSREVAEMPLAGL